VGIKVFEEYPEKLEKVIGDWFDSGEVNQDNLVIESVTQSITSDGRICLVIFYTEVE